MTPARRRYKYHAALSYAGEDRSTAKSLAALLKAAGLSVFYDAERRAHLWGKRQDEFERIYGQESRFVIPIVSRHYRREDWPQFEFAAAKKEAKRRKGEFILPVRVDDTPLLGLPQDVAYLNLADMSIREIAEAVLTKCGVKASAHTKCKTSRPPQSAQTSALSVLPRHTRLALGLIATAVFALPLSVLRRLFPQINWSKEVSVLRHRGLLVREKSCASASKAATRVFLSEPEDVRELHQNWVNALLPVRDHLDTAMLLALHRLRLGQLEEAVSVLVDVVEGMEPSGWATLYLTAISKLSQELVLKHLQPEFRVRLLNAMGICLSRAGQHENAILWFLRLRRYARAVKNRWGVGQSYINCGVACFNAGRHKQAELCYRRAVKWARKTGDQVLLGRSLSNLAQTVADRTPDLAQTLLEKGLAVKRSAQDDQGLVASYAAIGNLAVQHGDFAKAVRYYLKAMVKARSLGLLHEHGLMLSNLGSVNFDLGRHRRAVSFYRKARVVALQGEYDDVQLLAVQGEAKARFELGQYKQAEQRFRELAVLKAHTSDRAGEAVALHDLGVSLMYQKRMAGARQVLDTAIRAAREAKDSEWVAKCHIDQALTYNQGQPSAAVAKALKRAARSESRRRDYVAAAKLWEACAQVVTQDNIAPQTAECLLERCIECLSKAAGSHADQARVFGHLYFLQWQRGDRQGALRALRQMARVAVRGCLLKERWQAVNQQGVCLQDLGRLAEGAAAQRKAVRLARRLNDQEALQTSLNNLGEALRKSGKTSSALMVLGEAEKIAHARRDHEWSIIIAHNRALALDAHGKHGEAERLLKRCQQRARQTGLRREYTRAIEGLANLAASRGDLQTAERRYKEGLRAAKKIKARELQAQITLNLAALLRTAGKPRDGLRLLRPFEKDFATLVDAPVYYGLLAELHHEVGDLASAVACWEHAEKAAEATGSKSDCAHCKAALSKICEQQESLRRNELEVNQGLRSEKNPEKRTALLVRQFDLLLQRGREKNAEKVFEKARALAREHNLVALLVRLHILYGDYAWRNGYASRLNAMQAYIVAMLESLTAGARRFAQIAAHVVDQVIRASLGMPTRDLKRLAGDVERWLYQQAAGDARVVRLGLWPVRTALRLAEAMKQPSTYKTAIEKIIAEETTAAGLQPHSDDRAPVLTRNPARKIQRQSTKA